MPLASNIHGHNPFTFHACRRRLCGSQARRGWRSLSRPTPDVPLASPIQSARYRSQRHVQNAQADGRPQPVTDDFGLTTPVTLAGPDGSPTGNGTNPQAPGTQNSILASHAAPGAQSARPLDSNGAPEPADSGGQLAIPLAPQPTLPPAAPDGATVWQYQRELLGRMLSFLGPATLIPLGDPLMSLVDTVCIGQFAGTSQLAALGPANLVFAFAQYMFQSLQVASISLLAGFLRDGRLRRSEETLSTAVAVAAVLGLATTCMLETFPELIIRATGVRDAALVGPSAEYVRLRGLAQPAVLVTMVAQAGLLAQQDSLTPALTVALSTAVSLAGSVLFVAVLGWGLVGAALTTVATQYVGALALLYALSVKGKLRIRLMVPRREVVWQLATTMAPLSVTYIAKNVSYLCIQTTAAGLDTLKLAAHQATFSVWNLLGWTVTPFEQAALTYLPGVRGWRKRAGISLLIGMGAVGGICCGLAAGALILFAPHLFTRDPTVWPHMQSVVALAASSMFALGADVAASGCNIAMGDAKYVAQSFLVTLSVLGAFMAWVRAAGWELHGVWAGVVVFFGVRALQSAGRVMWKHMRVGTPEEEAEVEPGKEERAPVIATTWSSDGGESGAEMEPAAREAAAAAAEHKGGRQGGGLGSGGVWPGLGGGQGRGDVGPAGAAA